MSIATAPSSSSSQALVIAQSTALTTTTALPNVVKTLRDSDKELAVITRGKAGYAREGLLKSYARGAERTAETIFSGWFIPSAAVLVGLPAAVGACVAGGDMALIAGGCGAATTLVGMLAGIPAYYLSEWKAKLAAKTLISEDKVRPMIERFDNATGAQRAAYGVILVAWNKSMQEQKALSPEARHALDRACKEVDKLPYDARQAASALREIATAVTVKKWTVENVRSVEKLLNALPADQQLAIANDVYDLRAKADNDYDAMHALYDLKLKYTPVEVKPVDIQL